MTVHLSQLTQDKWLPDKTWKILHLWHNFIQWCRYASSTGKAVIANFGWIMPEGKARPKMWSPNRVSCSLEFQVTSLVQLRTGRTHLSWSHLIFGVMHILDLANFRRSTEQFLLSDRPAVLPGVLLIFQEDAFGEPDNGVINALWIWMAQCQAREGELCDALLNEEITTLLK